MDIRLPAIPSIASPLATAELYGLKTHPVGDRYAISCPFCAGNMWVFSESFLCENNRCEFLTGDSLDLLLRMMEGDTKRTSAWLGEAFHQRWECLGTDHNLVFRALQARRRLLEFFIRRISVEGRTTEEDRLMGLVEKHGVDQKIAALTAFPVLKESVPELVDLLRVYNSRASMDDDSYLVVPMFSRHHELAGVAGWASKTHELTYVTLATAKFSYSGMWLDSPMMKRHLLATHSLDAMLMNTEFKNRDPDSIAFGVNYDNAGPYTSTPLRNVTYLSTSEPTGLAVASRYHKRYVSSKFNFIDQAVSSGKPWSQFAYEALLAAHCDGVGKIRTTLELLSLSEEEIYEAKRRASEDNLPAIREAIEEFSQNPIIFDSGRYRIKQTPDGYVYETSDGWRTPLTNFTLSFNANLTFQDSGSIFHQGTMLFAGKKYPFTATPQELQGFKQLNERVLQGVVARSSTPSDTGLPYVSPDKNLQHVATHLQKLVSGLRCEPGTPHLGWTYDRKTFFTSSWMVTGDGVVPPAPLHPELERMGAFENIPLPEGSVSRKLPGDLCEIISMITATVVRAFLNYRLRPAVIRHDQNSARIIPALFKALGQTQPIRSPEKDRSLVGVPAYTFYDTQVFRANNRSPYFVLGGEGKVIQEAVGDDDIEAGTSVLRLILQRTAERLLSTLEGDVEKLFQRRPHILYSNELALEGYHWIAHVLEIPNWVKVPVPYTHLEKELSDKEPKNIAGMFFYEPVKERVHILKKALTGDVVSVGLELKSLVSSWDQTEDYFVIDHAHAAALLEHYYGRMISLPSIGQVASGE